MNDGGDRAVFLGDRGNLGGNNGPADAGEGEPVQRLPMVLQVPLGFLVASRLHAGHLGFKIFGEGCP